MEYRKENIEKAVNLFYRTEMGQQAEAHRWLTEAQNSSQAWNFVWELLNPNQSSEVQFFAATTLHTKLLKFWYQVPEDHYELLRSRILQSIVIYANGPKLILNRLCITLSAYVIHTIPTYWPNAFEELIDSFQPHNITHIEPIRIIWILLEILAVIPEEFQSTILASSRRIAVRNVLYESSTRILKFIENCFLPFSINSNVPDNVSLITYLSATKCIFSWIQLGCFTIEESSYVTSIMIDLICGLYWNRIESQSTESVEEQELIEVALEAISSIMLQPLSYKYPSCIIKHVSNINEKFGKILLHEKINANLNKDLVTGIYGLIITVADTHTKIVVKQLESLDAKENKIGTDILDYILDCSNMPGKYPIDETNSNLSFGFWYTLQEEILSSNTFPNTTTIVKEYYRKLVIIILTKSAYPIYANGGCSSKWSLDDKELFRCYRQDCADTLMYCFNVLNVEFLGILQNEFHRALYNCKRDVNLHWNTVEACLHAFSSVSECIEPDNLYLEKLMLEIRNLQYLDINVKVLASALNMVGAYSEWLSERPDILESVIPLLILGLSNADTAPNATLALKDVTRNCQDNLHPYADHLFLMCQSCLKSGELKLPERIRIMHILGSILSIIPADKIYEYVHLILGPSIEETKNLLTFSTSTGVAASLITRLKMTSTLFCSLNLKTNSPQPEPIVLIVGNMLPLYAQITEKYCDNDEMISTMCSLLKHVITSLMNHCKPLMENILQLLLRAYLHVPNAAILPLVRTIALMFGKDDNLKFLLTNFLNEISVHTLQLLIQLNNCNKLSEKSDIIEAFFLMMAQLLKRGNQLDIELDFVALFQCAILCLTVPEIHTMKACVTFIVEFLVQSRDTGCTHVVQSYGENLVNIILISLGGAAPRAASDILAEIFLVLNKKYCDDFTRWLHIQLQQQDFPSSLVTQQQKQHFVSSVLKEKVNKRKLLESITEFTLICRGIIQLEDG